MRASALRRSARRSWNSTAANSRKLPFATSGGPSPATGSEPPATTPPIRWRRSSTGSPPEVRRQRPGDRLAGRRRKIQDVFVDAKVPRSEREAWPLVVRGDEVVAVPGIVEHPEVRAERH